MTWKPHATVAVVVEDDQGRFLLVEEVSGGKVVFNQPAGHIEENEAIMDAVRRETLEETGWEIEPAYFLGVYTYKGSSQWRHLLPILLRGKSHQACDRQTRYWHHRPTLAVPGRNPENGRPASKPSCTPVY